MNDEILELQISFPPITFFILALVAGLVLPMILIPVARLVGYSEVVEEVAKTLVVLFLVMRLPTHKWQIIAALSFGVLFGVSENFLYLNQIFQLGDFSVFWQRFLWTVPMHMMTVLVILLARLSHRWFWIFGLIAAITMHALFNTIIVKMLIG